MSRRPCVLASRSVGSPGPAVGSGPSAALNLLAPPVCRAARAVQRGSSFRGATGEFQPPLAPSRACRKHLAHTTDVNLASSRRPRKQRRCRVRSAQTDPATHDLALSLKPLLPDADAYARAVPLPPHVAEGDAQPEASDAAELNQFTQLLRRSAVCRSGVVCHASLAGERLTKAYDGHTKPAPQE